MSFPRKVPLAKRKINYTVRNRFLGGSLAYAIGVGLAGEYFGWFNHLIIDYGQDDPAATVHRTQAEDERSWAVWSFKYIDRTTARAKTLIDENFIKGLPVGVQHFINDPKYILVHFLVYSLFIPFTCRYQLGNLKDGGTVQSDENDTIDVYERAPGMAPTKMKKDDLIIITSSKKQEGKTVD